MNAKENRIMTGRPSAATTGSMNDKAISPSPTPNVDPIDGTNHLWALRLWILCALLIVAYALTNYFLNLFLR
jgi:hypothetical protein